MKIYFDLVNNFFQILEQETFFYANRFTYQDLIMHSSLYPQISGNHFFIRGRAAEGDDRQTYCSVAQYRKFLPLFNKIRQEHNNFDIKVRIK